MEDIYSAGIKILWAGYLIIKRKEMVNTMKLCSKKCVRFIALFLTAVLLSTTVSQNVQAAKKKKTVVVYFSATGTTKAVAQKIKKATKGTLIGIQAVNPYTESDLDYGDDSSRVMKEHKSAASPATSTVRPKIKNLAKIKKAVRKADVVYIGYPIWWGEAPHIIYTLVENLNLKGKIVVPFCTSASSGLGKSGSHLKTKSVLSKKTKWKKGRGFYDESSQKAINKWVKTIK